MPRNVPKENVDPEIATMLARDPRGAHCRCKTLPSRGLTQYSRIGKVDAAVGLATAPATVQLKAQPRSLDFFCL